MSNMVVQTNVLALNSHRNLKTVGNAQTKASQRLSSGYKINSAADDAAGLSISEKMRAQIRGLDMASKNSQDAISLIQTAEGGMQEIDNMLQRVRELVTQASNDTNEHNTDETGDRQKMQDEINQLVEEIDAMAERVEFNKKKIINGSYSGVATTEAGTSVDNAAEIANLQSALDTAKAAFSTADSAYNDATVKYGAATAATSAFNANTLYTAYSGATSAGAVGSAYGSYTAAATSVTAADAAALTNLGTALGQDMANVTSATQTVQASAYTVSGAVNSGTLTGYTNSAAVGDTVTISGIEYSIISATGVTNTLTVTGQMTGIGHLESWASNVASADAYNSATAFVDSATATTDTDKLQAAKDYISAYDTANNLKAAYDNQVIISNQVKEQMMNLKDAVTAADSVKTTTLNAKDLANTEIELAQAKLDAAKAASLPITTAETKTGASLYFQVGANAGQGINVTINAIKSDKLGIGDGNGTASIDVLKDTGEDINGLLNTLDTALSYVTSERSKLGATQNRLEYAINSLDVSSENLSAAESRIRDTDMAKEMMNLTKANVLQQASTSMLAQANQAPQSVLQLLG